MQQHKLSLWVGIALMYGIATAFTAFNSRAKPQNARIAIVADTAIVQRHIADSLYRKADTCRQQERWEDALRHLNWAIKLYDKEPLYFLDRGALYIQITLPEKAILDLMTARKLDSTNATMSMKVYANLAVAENNLEHWDNAITYCNKTLAYNATWGFPYFIRSESYQHKGDTVKMCNDLTAALRYGIPQARERILRYCAKEIQIKP